MVHYKDDLGRPRLPYVIDPACGSGTFLIEYMKMIRRKLGVSEVAAKLPNRIREAHEIWFAGNTGNAWAREYLFGVENNYDLGLAAKVNMVLHGDGSMNTWIKSGLLPFSEYWVTGRNNILGTEKLRAGHPYIAPRNEQFDLLLSNPPFSLKLAPDEKAKVREAFHIMASAKSEAIFIERWYQLLTEGGSFCCILPEAILDTSTYKTMRLFLLRSFRIRAIVSLPYDAFRPFTSTKTCIVYATKRTAKELNDFQASLCRHEGGLASVPAANVLQQVFEDLKWTDEPVFMAEPEYAGYKRRKNLPDLALPNQLYREDAKGEVAEIDLKTPTTVLDYFCAGTTALPESRMGFWTNLREITGKEGLRLDPKYRWLWQYQKGVAYGEAANSQELSKFLIIVKFPKIPKGELSEEVPLLDLEYVESRQAIVRDDLPVVDILGSDKIKFIGCDLAISKLEPYLGKVIIKPNSEYVGSTEWVGLKLKTEIPLSVLAYLLMLPSMCEAYRRLQSGKRHARFDPKEFLKLRVQAPKPETYSTLQEQVEQRRKQILGFRQQEQNIRNTIDLLFSGGVAGYPMTKASIVGDFIVDGPTTPMT
jgi:type I restriction enzyme M protein